MSDHIVRKGQTGQAGNSGEFGTHARPESDAPLTGPASVTLSNGQVVSVDRDVADKFRGLSAEGYQVIVGWEDSTQPNGEYLIGLTPCCQAATTGSSNGSDEDGGVVCRACYNDVDPMLGADIKVSVPVVSAN
jgi:hypothetical protein